MTNPTIVSPVKMEYGWNFNISGLKMMVKSGLEKIFLKFLHAEAIFFKFILLTSFEENHKFSTKNNQLPAWRKIGNIFFAICTLPNSPVRAKVLSRFQFEGKNEVWTSKVRHVKEARELAFMIFSSRYIALLVCRLGCLQNELKIPFVWVK